jgi:ABC-type transport system involved in resistance to organic solvents, periplasmic component
MKRKLPTEAKVGIFVLLAILVLAYITIDVSQLGFTSRGTYTVNAIMNNAEGVTKKTPVQVAGIPVGAVEKVELLENHSAKVVMRIKDGVKIPKDAEIQVRIRGVLGDTYLEVLPGPGGATGELLESGENITKVRRRADYQDLFGDVSDITQNVKDITESLKAYTEVDRSHAAHILKNMEVLTANMAKFTNNNLGNMDAIVSNMRELTSELRTLAKDSGGEVQVAINRISELTNKISTGEGTVGRLLNDPTTIEKTNEILDNVSELTKSYSGMRTELSYHMEYLGGEGEVKNYVGFKLQPRPDKFFLFEVVHDPNPSATTNNEITTVSTGGITSVITTETEKFNKIRFSAELGKKFGGFTLRGGLIESTGGVGVDYQWGPVTASLNAFDFSADRPQLKFLTQLNITPSVFVLGGLDDFISREHGLNWIMGAGIRLTDEDIKSLIGGVAGLAR